MIEITVGPTEVLSLSERRPRRRKRRRKQVGEDEDLPVMINVAEGAFVEVHHHAASSSHEIGGLLIGEAYVCGGRIHVEIEAALVGETTDAGPAHVTFSAETWSRLLARQEREMSGKQIVGWYHSHPRMGIFLSAMDLTIHRHFFPRAWHVALVVNGQDQMAGFFAWDQEEIRRVNGFTWCSATRAPGGRVLWSANGSFPLSYQLQTLAEEQRLPSRWLFVGASTLAMAGLVGWLVLQVRRRRRRSRSSRKRRRP